MLKKMKIIIKKINIVLQSYCRKFQKSKKSSSDIILLQARTNRHNNEYPSILYNENNL